MVHIYIAYIWEQPPLRVPIQTSNSALLFFILKVHVFSGSSEKDLEDKIKQFK